MRFYRVIIAVVFLSLLGFQQVYAQNVQISFVQTASDGQLSAISGQPNQYSLTLNNVSPYITYFFGRPNRNTGLAPVKNFIDAWGVGSNSFAQNNPNAVIYAGQLNNQPNQAQTAYIVQISNPNYNIRSNQMTYTVTPLGKTGFVLDNITLAYITLVIN